MKIGAGNIGAKMTQELTGFKEVQQKTVPFSEFLKNSITDVNNLQLEAGKMRQQLVTGEITDIHQVMIASEKASISLQFAIQVRNKLVEAYQEIKRMQM
ncbi:MAG: flagellar hook-basal body complex protein FliE [Clostridia bacterium]|nr:flagellar hook-basal body complex protein FliE [Clostridia bacterium]